jgi:hypothetical protein
VTTCGVDPDIPKHDNNEQKSTEAAFCVILHTQQQQPNVWAVFILMSVANAGQNERQSEQMFKRSDNTYSDK